MILLLVDDDPAMLRIAAAVLEAAGHRVVQATDAAAALDALARERPDAALLDFVLPDSTGLDLLRAMRRTPAGSELPVVFLTGKGEDGLPEALRRAGAAGVIAKPFDPTTLAERVARLI